MQRGGFAIGVVVGLLSGLVLALGVALYIAKVPVPFVNKVPGRTAEQDNAEAERNRIFADAFGRDPDFFRFYRSMQAYTEAIKPGDTRRLLTPDSEFFRYFQDPNGRAPSSSSQR